MKKSVLIVKHVEQEGPGLLGKHFASAGWDITTVELSRGEPLPDTTDDITAVVILGGPMNVYEEEAYPFLRQEDYFIKEVLSAEVPLLGICLGAQLIAKACGERVMKAPQKELGWYSVDLTREAREDRLFKGVESPFAVFQWHEDTFDVPRGGVLLATSSVVRNQAFKVGSCAYGLQFHVEASLDIIDGWMRGEKKSERESIISHGRSLERLLDANAATIFGNFIRMAEATTRVQRVLRLFIEPKEVSPRALQWDELMGHEA